MTGTNWKSIFNGTTKTNLRKFINGEIGSRSLINSSKTGIARAELYRLERNNSVRDMRRLISKAFSR